MPYKDLTKRRECQRASAVRSRTANPQKHRDALKKWYRSASGQAWLSENFIKRRQAKRRAHFKKRSGLDVSPVIYDRLYELQGGLCAMGDCKRSLERPNLDHNHETKELRGLLCWSCNVRLGYYEALLHRAVAFESYRANPPMRLL